jgi:hypothetical protein
MDELMIVRSKALLGANPVGFLVEPVIPDYGY